MTSPRKVFAYGPPGTFKTTGMCLYAPKPILLLDVDCKADRIGLLRPLIEGGDLIIKTFEFPLLEDSLRLRGTKVDVPPQRQPQGYMNVINYLNDVLDGKPSIPKHECLGLDSLTRLIEHLTRLINFTCKRPTLVEKDWGIFLVNLEDIMGHLTVYDKAVFVTAHDQIERDDESGRVLGVAPLIGGQMRRKITGYFDEAWHFEPMIAGTNVRYLVRVMPSSIITARTSVLTEVIIDIEAACKGIWNEGR